MIKKYIDAEKLKAEIERHIKDVKDAEKKFTPNMGFFDAKLSGIYDVLAIIDSLQQEQSEVDLEKEIDKTVSECTNGYNFDWDRFAHHFYELGLNTRKEE